ncbi:MAG: hypothetical protein IIV87_02300, partial [Oscillospiraceae bacterium]|nr:hypothetical protein [Oscillospiraceae bacterium]
MKEKHTKNCKYFMFCTLFFAVCIVPLAAMMVFGASKPASNETLAAPPKIVRGGTLNKDVLSDTAAYFADRFAFRQELITANSALHMGVLGESPVKNVLAGKDGWLFYADTLADYTGESAMTEREIFCAARSLYLVQEYAASQGADFVFTAAPNKNSLFFEKMPNNYIKSTEKSNVQRIYEELDEQNVTYCDLHTALMGKENTYRKTDSHWNGYGSAIAHDALMQTLARPERLADEEFTEKAFEGDLAEMLYPSSDEQEMSLALARERTFAYASPIRAADDMLIETSCETGSGSLLMFRDSFGNVWHEDLAECFASARFSRAMPYDLTMLDDADTLVIELVERNLPQLAQKAPVMPAPVRAWTAEGTADDAQVSIKITEDTAMDALVRYTGTLTWAGMDDDSPICAEIGG